MTNQGHKELVEELNKLKVDVSKLRDTLSGLDKEKESWFEKKSGASSKIKSGIEKIKQLKLQRDQLTAEVKELKTKRQQFNSEVKQESTQLNSLKEGKEKIFKDLKMDENPSRLRQELERLEFKMETEPMSFANEQALMKKINHLRQKVEATKVISAVNRKVRESSSGLRETRKEANDVHRQIQEKAKKSQEILKISAEIDSNKPAEKESYEKFTEFKKQFMELSGQLKEKLKAMDEIRAKLGDIAEERKESRKQQQQNFLKTKEQEVEDKIKRGEKLTTEDLLIFQNLGK
jgi:uncharacterized coiled-coil DUF342 family protein